MAGLCRSNMLLRFRLVAVPGGDASLRVLPPEVPQVLPSGLDVRFLQPRIVADLVPLVSSVQIAGIDTNASHLVRDLSLLKEILHAAVEVENLLFVLNGSLAIPLESIGHRHRSSQ